ncbi:MAG: hypothetical protein SGI84_02075 [Gemmatimonadota bacterium]|nr:hypothetical protein [Gemmatimonadota bacterium]
MRASVFIATSLDGFIARNGKRVPPGALTRKGRRSVRAGGG